MKRFAVIGLGKFGGQLARFLYEDGHEVIGVDKNKNNVQNMGGRCTEAIVLDARDKNNLEQLGIEHFDVVIVSCGSDISSSVLICLHLKELGAKTIKAKVQDDDHGKILNLVGNAEVINPERDIARKLTRELNNPNILEYLPLESQYDIVKLMAPKIFLDKSIKELDVRAQYKVFIIGLEYAGSGVFELLPSPSTVIRDGDELLFIGRTEDLLALNALTTEEP